MTGQHTPRLEVTIHDGNGDTQQRSFKLRCTDTPEKGTLEERAGYVVTADLTPDNIDELRRKAHLFGHAAETTEATE